MTVHFGDCREVMRAMIDRGERLQMCVTSPPYWGLRDYGVDGQIGLEASPVEFVATMVEVFDLVYQLLADDGTAWINISGGYKDKQLCGTPWRTALALQEAGWYLRQDIIWHKPNPMPETLSDRCTKAHEYLFLLAKTQRYYFDLDAIKEPVSGTANSRGKGVNPKAQWKTPDGWDTSKGAGGHGSFHKNGREKGAPRSKQNESFSGAVANLVDNRNKRSVWTVPSEAFPGAHFATFPQALIEPCILAGSRPGDIVLDCFFGSGTTGQVCNRLGRKYIGIKLNQDYEPLQRNRTAQQGFEL